MDYVISSERLRSTEVWLYSDKYICIPRSLIEVPLEYRRLENVEELEIGKACLCARKHRQLWPG